MGRKHGRAIQGWEITHEPVERANSSHTNRELMRCVVIGNTCGCSHGIKVRVLKHVSVGNDRNGQGGDDGRKGIPFGRHSGTVRHAPEWQAGSREGRNETQEKESGRGEVYTGAVWSDRHF